MNFMIGLHDRQLFLTFSMSSGTLYNSRSFKDDSEAALTQKPNGMKLEKKHSSVGDSTVEQIAFYTGHDSDLIFVDVESGIPSTNTRTEHAGLD